MFSGEIWSREQLKTEQSESLTIISYGNHIVTVSGKIPCPRKGANLFFTYFYDVSVQSKNENNILINYAECREQEKIVAQVQRTVQCITGGA